MPQEVWPGPGRGFDSRTSSAEPPRLSGSRRSQPAWPRPDAHGAPARGGSSIGGAPAPDPADAYAGGGGAPDQRRRSRRMEVQILPVPRTDLTHRLPDGRLEETQLRPPGAKQDRYFNWLKLSRSSDIDLWRPQLQNVIPGAKVRSSSIHQKSELVAQLVEHPPCWGRLRVQIPSATPDRFDLGDL